MPGRSAGIWPGAPAPVAEESKPVGLYRVQGEIPDYDLTFDGDGPPPGARAALVAETSPGSGQLRQVIAQHEFDDPEGDAISNPVAPWSWENGGNLVGSSYSTGTAGDGELAMDGDTGGGAGTGTTIGTDVAFHFYKWFRRHAPHGLITRTKVLATANPNDKAGIFLEANRAGGWGGLYLEHDAGLASLAVILNAAGSTRTAVAITDPQGAAGVWLWLQVHGTELRGYYSTAAGWTTPNGQVHPPHDLADWSRIPGTTTINLPAALATVKIGVALENLDPAPYDPAFYRPRTIDPCTPIAFLAFGKD